MADPGPTTCTCQNVCNRAQVEGGRRVRNACPCLSNGHFCSSKCACGYQNMQCTNRLGRGGELEERMAEDDEIDTFLEEEVPNEGLMVAFSDEPPFMVPLTESLDRSLQCEAEEHLESSFAEGEDNRIDQTSTPMTTNYDALTDNMQNSSGSGAASAAASDSNVLTPDTICAMPKEKLENILCTLLRLYPDLVTDAMEPEPPLPPEDQVPPFCKCLRCEPMPTTKEQLCCKRGLRPGQCITIREAGILNQVVLSRTALQQAVRDHNDINFLDDDENCNDTLRHMAYRKYILLKFGYLGPNERRVIPSCVVWRIRHKYPSADGTYTGYKSARR